MMDRRYHKWRLVRQVGVWSLLGALGLGIWAVYRWAEPKPLGRNTVSPSHGTTVTLRLENTRFAGSVNGWRTWALWARRLDIEKTFGGNGDIRNAILTDIRGGVLYPAPRQPMPTLELAGLTSASGGVTPAADPTAGPALAKFHAAQGRYVVGDGMVIPPDLMGFTIQSQIELSGDVDFVTHAGDHLKSEQMIIYNLINRKTYRAEQRIVCNSGVSVSHKDIRVQANQARYDPNGRTVECQGGVRGVYKDGTVQAERAFWQMGEEILRCPETASGVLPTTDLSDPTPYTAEDVTINFKRRKLKASRIFLTIILKSGATDTFAQAAIPENTGAFPMQTRFVRSNLWARPALALVGLGAGIGHTLLAGAASNPAPGRIMAPQQTVKSASKMGHLKIVDAQFDNATSLTIGHDFQYTEGDRVVTGSKGKYNTSLKLLDLESNIVIDDPEHHVTGDKAHVDIGPNHPHFATMDGNVVVVIKPTQTAAGKADSDVNKERDKGVTITCDHMDDQFRRKFITMRGHLVFKQKITKKDGTILDRTLTAEHAEYNGKQEEMLLFAPVNAKDSDERNFHSDQNVTVGTKEGQETINTHGPISIDVPVQDEDTSDEGPNTATTTPPKVGK